MQHGGLQDATERDRLRRVLLASTGELLDLFGQVGVQRLAQLGQIGAARAEDGLAVRVVRQRVEQVLERQVRVPTRGGFAVRDGEDDLECLAEHLGYGLRATELRATGLQALSMAACRG